MLRRACLALRRLLLTPASTMSYNDDVSEQFQDGLNLRGRGRDQNQGDGYGRGDEGR